MTSGLATLKKGQDVKDVELQKVGSEVTNIKELSEAQLETTNHTENLIWATSRI